MLCVCLCVCEYVWATYETRNRIKSFTFMQAFLNVISSNHRHSMNVKRNSLGRFLYSLLYIWIVWICVNYRTVVSLGDGANNQESTKEQIFENIRLHKEVLQSVKMQPWSMRRKLRLVRQVCESLLGTHNISNFHHHRTITTHPHHCNMNHALPQHFDVKI